MPLALLCKSSFHVFLIPKRNKHLQEMDGRMDGLRLTAVHFVLLPSLALSGLHRGSILSSPCTAIKENTLKRNTQNLILYTGRVCPRNSHLRRTQRATLQVWSSEGIHTLYTKSRSSVNDSKHSLRNTTTCTDNCKRN